MKIVCVFSQYHNKLPEGPHPVGHGGILPPWWIPDSSYICMCSRAEHLKFPLACRIIRWWFVVISMLWCSSLRISCGSWPPVYIIILLFESILWFSQVVLCRLVLHHCSTDPSKRYGSCFISSCQHVSGDICDSSPLGCALFLQIFGNTVNAKG